MLHLYLLSVRCISLKKIQKSKGFPLLKKERMVYLEKVYYCIPWTQIFKDKYNW